MNAPNSLPSNHLPQPTLYLGQRPNQPIQLYKGNASIIQGEEVVEGKATVSFVWFPHPRVNFKFTHFTETEVKVDDVTLKLAELGVSVKAHVSEWTHFGADNRYLISGYPCEPVVKGSGQELASLVFHLPNFPFFNISNTWEREEDEEDLEGWLEMVFEGQFVFQFGDWRLILATLPENWEIEELLRSQGGYAMTHVCKLERLERNPFYVDDARDQLKAFSYYLSFARGLWMAPILLAGFDATGKQVFEEWSACQSDSWQNTEPWFSTDSIELVEAFPGFMLRWQDSTWRESVKLAIRWYVESNKQAGGVEAAIVLEQTALEGLAWILIVKDKCIFDWDGFHKISAANKIRQLLSQLGIALNLPSNLTELTQLAKAQNWFDGPQALTEMRNGIIHANPKNHQKVFGSSPLARGEAWNLGLQYLELVLLKLFDYPYAYPYDLKEK